MGRAPLRNIVRIQRTRDGRDRVNVNGVLALRGFGSHVEVARLAPDIFFCLHT
jgi:hypothetical protein